MAEHEITAVAQRLHVDVRAPRGRQQLGMKLDEKNDHRQRRVARPQPMGHDPRQVRLLFSRVAFIRGALAGAGPAAAVEGRLVSAPRRLECDPLPPCDRPKGGVAARIGGEKQLLVEREPLFPVFLRTEGPTLSPTRTKVDLPDGIKKKFAN